MSRGVIFGGGVMCDTYAPFGCDPRTHPRLPITSPPPPRLSPPLDASRLFADGGGFASVGVSSVRCFVRAFRLDSSF